MIAQVAQLKPRERHVLNSDATVYIINHGDDAGDSLSPLGKRQAQQRSVDLDVARVFFDFVICPADLRLRTTATHALHHRRHPKWQEYTGSEFRGPRSEKDFSDMHALIERVKAQRSIKFVPRSIPATLYALCKHELRDTPNNFFERFKEEIRHDTSAIPDIGNAHRIAFFISGVVGNLIAEALFPQFAEEIERIELNPCDILRVSAAGCQHFPLLY